MIYMRAPPDTGPATSEREKIAISRCARCALPHPLQSPDVTSKLRAPSMMVIEGGSSSCSHGKHGANSFR